MKRTIHIFSLFAISMAILFTSCSKETKSSKEDDYFKSTAANEEAEMILKSDGKLIKMIIKPLVKPEDCLYIVEGTIEFYDGDKIVAIIDFGDGECDNIATKTIGDKIFEFTLKKTNGGDKYDKVIVEPLVKIEGCDYIVSGVIDFYKGDTWVATIDFGDGECDEWATKIWEGGSKVFSMKKQ